jgi:hypothetical protein
MIHESTQVPTIEHHLPSLSFPIVLSHFTIIPKRKKKKENNNIKNLENNNNNNKDYKGVL